MRCKGRVLVDLDPDPRKCFVVSVPNPEVLYKGIKIGYMLTENGEWLWTPMRGKYPSSSLDKYFYAKECGRAEKLGLNPLPKEAPIRRLLKDLKADSTLPAAERIISARRILSMYGDAGKEFMKRFCWANVPQSGKDMEEDYKEEAREAGCGIDEITYIHMASMMAHLYFPQPELEVIVRHNLLSLEQDLERLKYR